MADVIQLLPDAIANQIAAGEVIQRPASVVKELLENAVDAGSTNIKLIVKDAGKTLIQIVDNGCGMSETDARMSFERHATSKIKVAQDLFELRTMGFRGEALASIASIAQVELRTRQQKNELGTRISIEGSQLKVQEPCQCVAGTNIAVKNLFFNVPARRNFLKTNTVEMRHITDEFQRVALAHPDIFFTLQHNGSEVFHLPSTNLRQRIVNILGQNSNKKLVPVSEETDLIKISGFVGKPDYAKKTRGEQYFFVNSRFIKSGWLNHAIITAYEDLLPQNTYPLYVIFIDIDPAHIDINVHPTKQEIKFDDDKMMYNYLKVSVRHALGQYSVTPSLDFEQEAFLNTTTQPQGVWMPGSNSSNPSASTARHADQNTSSSSIPFESNEDIRRQRNNIENWETIYEGLDIFGKEDNEQSTTETITFKSKISSDANELDDDSKSFSNQQKQPYQIHNRYIINQVKSGFWVIDQQAAHERILYEKYWGIIETDNPTTQRKLFPQTVHLTPADAILLKDILPQVIRLGFDIETFGGDSFIIHGVPADLPEGMKEQEVIEKLITQYQENLELDLGLKENIARSLALSASIKRGTKLNFEEMEVLIDKLFACAMPFKSPTGKKCFITFELDDLDKQFME